MQGTNMQNNMQNNMQGSTTFGAHEIIGMNEALMTKAANVEMLSFLSEQVQDQRLQNMLRQQAQTAHQHYIEGVNLLQGHGTHMAQPNTVQYQGQMNVQPKLGLRQPSMPAPNMNAQTVSERSVCTVALNMHKFGAIGWTTLALECTSPQLRSYLMNGASMCDRMAYDVWEFMNSKGYYQVPTLLEKTTQTMIQAYQVPQQMNPQATGMPWGQHYQ
ncbi:spore coat protein [Alicyclobacillus tolerans]|uniref:spore coat protein n=1 Tax=Alicyclobacillus tolerans TaxID=90970 RepID=UPI001F3EACE8|nr:spore coat protein [Alicyclobacillus tolerans]MCF8566573.1 spore coat protein [Alicyclobacillus tolerans]